MKYGNIFYFDRINKIGGVETFFYNIAKMYGNKDITIFYGAGDVKQIERLKKYVRVVQWTGQEIECEKAFFNYSLRPINKVHAKEYYEIIHANYKQIGLKPNLHPKIDKYLGVSQSVCDAFTEVTGLPCELCYNPVQIDEYKKTLILVSATRLTREKGKHRIIKLAEALEQAGISYIWYIFTNDTKVIPNPHIIYMEPQLNIIDYLAMADYVVQLSDTEAYCYTMIESLLAGTPIIVTQWDCLKELGITEEYGFILPLDMKNIPVEEIATKKFNFKYTPKKDNWDKLLYDAPSSYNEERESLYEVCALPLYSQLGVSDAQLGVVPKPGRKWIVTFDRMELLTGGNKEKRRYVDVSRVIPPWYKKKEK